MIESLQDMNQQEYHALVDSGMFWEMYPEATGCYAEDVEQHRRNPIRILVVGGVGTGKSVIIQLIKDSLESNGFDVKSLDDEFDLTYKFNERVSLVASSTTVEIVATITKKGHDNV